MLSSWMALATASTALVLESHKVIGMRLTRMAWGGSAALYEANLMVSEKTAAFSEAMGTIASGGSSQSVVDGYLVKVRANRARLAAG